MRTLSGAARADFSRLALYRPICHPIRRTSTDRAGLPQDQTLDALRPEAHRRGHLAPHRQPRPGRCLAQQQGIAWSDSLESFGTASDGGSRRGEKFPPFPLHCVTLMTHHGQSIAGSIRAKQYVGESPDDGGDRGSNGRQRRAIALSSSQPEAAGGLARRRNTSLKGMS